MTTKKIKHKRIEKCMLCKKDINTEVDNYAIILDCIGADISSQGFYHTKCLKDVIEGKGKLIQEKCREQISPIMRWAENTLNRVLPRKEVYEIKADQQV